MVKKREIEKVNENKYEVSELDFIICPNCGATEVGRFCPNCGQSNKDLNKPFKDIIGELLDSINLDVRLLNTLIPFFIKPGFLAQEYFKGKRKRYVPPMRMYMFFSILFFFLLQYTNNNTDKVRNDIIKFNNGSTNKNITFDKGINDESSKLNQNINLIKSDSTTKDTIVTLDNFSDIDKDKIRKEVLNDSTNSDILKELIVGAINASEKKELFFEKFIKNLSYSIFLLMPFFALILAMILWKSKMLYVKHLIFSINFHSFIFGISSLVIIFDLILPEKYSYLGANLLWGIPVYLMVGIKRFYNRKYIGAFFKMFGALSIYAIILSIVVLAILMITAQGFYET